MKILYGSQNFGFDTHDSDYDYMVINLPAWRDILMGGMESRTIINSLGLEKQLDIRKYAKNLMKGGFSDLQTLYAKQYEGCGDLQWFIDNRDRIVHMDLITLYNTNKGCMGNMLKRKDFRAKDLTHLYVFNRLLHKVIEEPNFDIYDSAFRDYRLSAEKWDADRIKKETDAIIRDTEFLKERYILLDSGIDTQVEKEIWEEVTRILLKHFNNPKLQISY